MSFLHNLLSMWFLPAAMKVHELLSNPFAHSQAGVQGPSRLSRYLAVSSKLDPALVQVSSELTSMVSV